MVRRSSAVGSDSLADWMLQGSAIYVFGDKKNDHGLYSVVLDNRPAEVYSGISGCGGAYGQTCEQQKPTLEYFASNLDGSLHNLTITNIAGVNNSFFGMFLHLLSDVPSGLTST
ncbi:hypothetical protein DXG03_002281 [Asterophora parasitica]|uniref:Uncharacterized protein n=1 Tax=Asterophora parasitica TaxID=117018 RepID=A0A9P7G3N4_9AGAR|nr:hypothetical protein DXG03_002281 [Asterophora parasitica]